MRISKTEMENAIYRRAKPKNKEWHKSKPEYFGWKGAKSSQSSFLCKTWPTALGREFQVACYAGDKRFFNPLEGEHDKLHYTLTTEAPFRLYLAFLIKGDPNLLEASERNRANQRPTLTPLVQR